MLIYQFAELVSKAIINILKMIDMHHKNIENISFDDNLLNNGGKM
jgi:hypothetical protein